MTLNREGRNRFVILTERYAIKIPSLRSWRDFLFGLLNNQNEALKPKSPDLCPVLYAFPGGWFIVMPRVKMIDMDEMVDCGPIVSRICRNHNVEFKHSSFGYLNGKLVAVDYGW